MDAKPSSQYSLRASTSAMCASTSASTRCSTQTSWSSFAISSSSRTCSSFHFACIFFFLARVFLRSGSDPQLPSNRTTRLFRRSLSSSHERVAPRRAQRFLRVVSNCSASDSRLERVKRFFQELRRFFRGGRVSDPRQSHTGRPAPTDHKKLHASRKRSRSLPS